jgi:hypothetical protein
MLPRKFRQKKKVSAIPTPPEANTRSRHELELLGALCPEDTAITYTMSTGAFALRVNGGAPIPVTL